MQTNKPGLALLLGLATVAAVQAHDFRVGAIVIDHPYALAGGSDVYFRALRNEGGQPERLLDAGSPAAARIELLHEGRPRALQLAGGAELTMRHDGPWRLALRELKAPLKAGDTVRVTLRFERAGEITVPAQVVNAAARRGR